MDLTDKQKLFVEAYLQHFNATRAARESGYTGNENTLGSVGWENLQKPAIKARISERLAEKAMDANEVLARLAAHASGDLSEFLTDSGAIDWEAVKEKGVLVKRVSHTKGKQSSIELYDAQAALALLAKHHGLLRDATQNLHIDMARLTNEQLNRIAAGEDPVRVLATTSTSRTGAPDEDSDR